MRAVSARIEGILAREADVAVVFRRGPGNCVQCLRWDLARDEVVAGQWVRGRITVKRCDLSPDGELLVVALTNYSMGREQARAARGDSSCHCWSTVSRLPYFTALAFWEDYGCYGGGGVWPERRRLGLNALDPRITEEVRETIRIEPLEPSRTDPEAVFAARLRLAGWHEAQRIELREPPGTGPVYPRYDTEREGIWIKPFAGGELRRRLRYEREIWELRDEVGTVHREFHPTSRGTPFLDVDHRGRVIFGEAGCLWAWNDFPNGEPTLVADLNANTFEAIAPPDWVREWPT